MVDRRHVLSLTMLFNRPVRYHIGWKDENSNGTISASNGFRLLQAISYRFRAARVSKIPNEYGEKKILERR